jgi:hypothetical protein
VQLDGNFARRRRELHVLALQHRVDVRRRDPDRLSRRIRLLPDDPDRVRLRWGGGRRSTLPARGAVWPWFQLHRPERDNVALSQDLQSQLRLHRWNVQERNPVRLLYVGTRLQSVHPAGQTRADRSSDRARSRVDR